MEIIIPILIISSLVWFVVVIIEKIKKKLGKIMEETIVEVSCTSKNGVLFEEKGILREVIYFPQNYNGQVSIALKNESKKTKISLQSLEELLSIEASKATLEKYPDLEKIKGILNKDKDNIKYLEYDFFNLENFTDITDCEFNNFAKIEKANLVSDGLWIGNGIRKIQLEFDENFDKFIDSESNKNRDNLTKIELSAYFDQKNNDVLDEKIIFSGQRNNTECTILLDTDKLADYFDDNIASHTFYGKIQISATSTTDVQNNEQRKRIFYFPFEIKMKNPILSKEHIKTEQIAIDFGTSSTCIARDDGNELVSFSDNPESMLDYENMTAIILYNWGAIYKGWDQGNNTIPHFNRSKESAEHVNINHGHFNYGDTIKEELKNAPDAKTMDAIITKLKALPGKLENDKANKEEVVPFDKDIFQKKVYLTDDIEAENDETLNPIALYGYFIGRSLNLQIGNKIYSQYTITMPVNFNKYKREKIQKSLEYGLRRSLPVGLKDQLEVKIGYEESVALLGAAKKLKHLRLVKDKKATLFAVFDFGGGTLDFAFGLYRKSSDDKNISLHDNEEEICDDVIEIFKTDGELVGGEVLIESLSYSIYKDNKEIMKENKISIAVPESEDELENFPKNLMGKRHIDHVNLKSFNERFSRDFFINGEFSQDKVELFSIENSNDGQEITVENLSKEKANEFLDEKISKMVENFKNVLIKAFGDNSDRLKLFGYDEFNIQDVKIFQAGNACKARWVENSFNEVFGDHENIIFINNEEKKITPKNAVAKGLLMLGNTKVHNHSVAGMGDKMPLDRYIWNIKEVEDVCENAKPLLSKGDNVKSDWKNIAKRNENKFKIYYSTKSSIEDEDDSDLESHTITIPHSLIEDNKFNVWAKPYDGIFIECILATRNGESMDEAKKMIIDLNTGEIIK